MSIIPTIRERPRPEWVITPRQAVMPVWIGPAQKAVVNPEFVCGATIRPSIPMRLRASISTFHLTICVGHIPDLMLWTTP
ncbi:MAG: hypothetical protein JXQ99_29770, partial [Hyphomicrobiaceae bacterium]